MSGVEVIENISLIEGQIVSRQTSTSREGFDDVCVVLDQAVAVDERAELLHRRVGEELVIEVATDLLGAAQPGDAVRGHVLVAGPGKIVAAPEAVPTGGEWAVIAAGPQLGQG